MPRVLIGDTVITRAYKEQMISDPSPPYEMNMLCGEKGRVLKTMVRGGKKVYLVYTKGRSYWWPRRALELEDKSWLNFVQRLEEKC